MASPSADSSCEDQKVRLGLERVSSKLTRRDLHEAGALFMNDPCPSNLDNAVHPIFRTDNFLSTPHQYSLILPSLRLATKILDDPQALHWFDALLNSPRRYLPEASFLSQDLSAYPEPIHGNYLTKSPWHFGDRYSFYLRESFDVHHYLAVQKKLRSLQCDITFRFVENGPFTSTRDFKALISLEMNMLEYLACPPDYSDHSVGQILRMQLYYTICILHELAHAVSATRDEKCTEDYFQDERLSEEGFSLEQAIFGGVVHFSGQSLSSCLWFHEWPDFWDVNCPTGPALAPPPSSIDCYLIPMDYVQGLFSKEFWRAKDMAKPGEITLRFPKTVGQKIWKVEEGDARCSCKTYAPLRAIEEDANFPGLEGTADGFDVL